MPQLPSWFSWPGARSPAGGADALLRVSSDNDERLSEYVNDNLPAAERAALERELQHDAELREALQGMRAVADALRSLGVAEVPRPFTLRATAVPRQVGLPRVELLARLATA